MFRYRAFGLTITSELPLELPADQARVGASAEAGTGELCIRRGRVAPVDDLPLRLGSIRYGSLPGRIQVEVPWAARYLAEDGRLITVDVEPDATDSMVSTYITGFLLLFILDAAGALLLHGSAVSHQGQALLFCGVRGAGKSTLAGALARRGCPVLCDDAIPLRDGPLALPGIPSLKLLPDAYGRLVGSPDKDQPPSDGDGKYRAELGAVFDPLPLAGVYILNPGGCTGLSIEALHGMAKIQALLANATNLGGSAASAGLFRKAVRILGKARVYRVSRPEQGDSLAALAECVLNHIGEQIDVPIL
jgi:hypothetical protein